MLLTKLQLRLKNHCAIFVIEILTQDQITKSFKVNLIPPIFMGENFNVSLQKIKSWFEAWCNFEMASMPSAFSSGTFNFRSRAGAFGALLFQISRSSPFPYLSDIKKVSWLWNDHSSTKHFWWHKARLYMPVLTPALIDIFWVLLVSSRDEHARLSTIPDTASLFRHCVGPKEQKSLLALNSHEQ